MKKIILVIILLFLLKNIEAQTVNFADSLKAIGFYTEIAMPKNVNYSMLQFGQNVVTYNYNIKGSYFFASNLSAISTIRNAKGQHRERNGVLEYVISVRPVIHPKNVKFYISTIRDSTTSHIAFYATIDSTNRWKYIGTFITKDTNNLRSFSFIKNKKDNTSSLQNTWVQYENKGWKAVDTNLNKIPPSFRPFNNIDSLKQIVLEQKQLKDSLKANATLYKGLYYTMIKEGTGEQVKVTDTVVIHYKGWLFNNGQIFDETKEEPATFPLNRLIPGWQIGVPLCKVGGKIRLYIPSGLAYGIRNLATTIPPNSTLVFDVEVLEVKR
jgi:FKBP-type peptidyl-prolyl cis-trans isomerase FkpA